MHSTNKQTKKGFPLLQTTKSGMILDIVTAAIPELVVYIFIYAQRESRATADLKPSAQEPTVFCRV